VWLCFSQSFFEIRLSHPAGSHRSLNTRICATDAIQVDEESELCYDLSDLRPLRDPNALAPPLCDLCATVRVLTDRVFKPCRKVGAMRLEYAVNRSSMKEIGKGRICTRQPYEATFCITWKGLTH